MMHRSERRRCVGEHERATLAAMFRYYAQHGLAGNPKTLRWLLGRAAHDLAEFLGRVAGQEIWAAFGDKQRPIASAGKFRVCARRSFSAAKVGVGAVYASTSGHLLGTT